MGTILLNEINVAFIDSISDLMANQEVRFPAGQNHQLISLLLEEWLLCLGSGLRMVGSPW